MTQRDEPIQLDGRLFAVLGESKCRSSVPRAQEGLHLVCEHLDRALPHLEVEAWIVAVLVCSLCLRRLLRGCLHRPRSIVRVAAARRGGAPRVHTT